MSHKYDREKTDEQIAEEGLAAMESLDENELYLLQYYSLANRRGFFF